MGTAVWGEHAHGGQSSCAAPAGKTCRRPTQHSPVMATSTHTELKAARHGRKVESAPQRREADAKAERRTGAGGEEERRVAQRGLQRKALQLAAGPHEAAQQRQRQQVVVEHHGELVQLGLLRRQRHHAVHRAAQVQRVCRREQAVGQLPRIALLAATAHITALPCSATTCMPTQSNPCARFHPQ